MVLLEGEADFDLRATILLCQHAEQIKEDLFDAVLVRAYCNWPHGEANTDPITDCLHVYNFHDLLGQGLDLERLAGLHLEPLQGIELAQIDKVLHSELYKLRFFQNLPVLLAKLFPIKLVVLIEHRRAEEVNLIHRFHEVAREVRLKGLQNLG